MGFLVCYNTPTMKQSEALDILKMGENVFLTGPAGSGKTYVLNDYINFLKNKGVSVGITASTGIAATHIGGMTIHSWAGIGINDSMSESDIRDLFKKKHLGKRFKHTKVLVFGYNIVAIPAAAGVFAHPIFFGGFFLRPEIGAFVMSLSTVIVVANAMMLKKVNLDV